MERRCGSSFDLAAAIPRPWQIQLVQSCCLRNLTRNLRSEKYQVLLPDVEDQGDRFAPPLLRQVVRARNLPNLVPLESAKPLRIPAAPS